MIRVEEYYSGFQADWDFFVQNKSRNGGLFHEMNFLGYHPVDKFDDASLLLFHKDELVGVFPAVYIEKENKKEVVSHLGSSSGGLVYAFRSSLEKVFGMLDAIINYYRTKGVANIEMRLSEPIFSFPSDEELRYSLWYRGFEVQKEISSCVYLDDRSLWLEFGRKKNKVDINRFKREGVVVEMTDEIELSYTLIEKNLKEKYNKKPVHSLAELKDLKRRCPDKFHFWIVRKEDEVLGTFMAIDVNGSAIHDFYIAKNTENKKYNVMPFLFYSAFEFYRDQGYQWFNYGISSRADWIKWGILEAKEKMGGRASVRESWRKENISEIEG